MLSNVSTNFDPSDTNLGGSLIPKGSSRHDEIIAITDEIINVGSASFGRVTGSSPTPAGLQQFARTVNPGNNNYIDYNNDSFAGYDALYFKADPALNSGDQAVLFAIMSGEFGHPGLIADPVATGITTLNTRTNAPCFSDNNMWRNDHTDPDRENLSNMMGSQGSDNNSQTRGGHVIFSRYSDPNTSRPQRKTPLGQDHRMWVFCTDKHIIFKSRSVTDERTSGVWMFWLNPPPSDGHYTRSEVPAIFGRSFRRFNDGEVIQPGYRAGGETRGRRVRVDDELRQIPSSSDVKGREIIQNQETYSYFQLPAYHGKIPGLKVVRDEAVSTWDTMTINGNNWVCFHRDSGRGYLTRYENAK